MTIYKWIMNQLLYLLGKKCDLEEPNVPESQFWNMLFHSVGEQGMENHHFT